MDLEVLIRLGASLWLGAAVYMAYIAGIIVSI